MAELKDFAAQLKSLPNITRHIHLAEAVNKVIAKQSFRDRVSVEQSLLDGRDIDKCCETIEVVHMPDQDKHPAQNTVNNSNVVLFAYFGTQHETLYASGCCTSC